VTEGEGSQLVKNSVTHLLENGNTTGLGLHVHVVYRFIRSSFIYKYFNFHCV